MKKLIRWFRKEKVFITFFILSPGIWWIVFKLPQVFDEWLKFSYYVNQKFSSIFVEERLVTVGLMRWANIDNHGFVGKHNLSWTAAFFFLMH